MHVFTCQWAVLEVTVHSKYFTLEQKNFSTYTSATKCEYCHYHHRCIRGSVFFISFLPNPACNNRRKSNGWRKSYGRCSLVCSIGQSKSSHFFTSLIGANSYLQGIIIIIIRWLKIWLFNSLRELISKESCTFCNRAGTSTPALIRA